MIKKNNNFRILGENRYVSNDTRETHLNNNDLIVGSSGSGKTGGYVIPNILACDTSFVVADTKSNLYKKLTPELQKKGYEIRIIDFVNPKNSSGYNPLKYIRRDRKTGVYNQQDIISIANTMLPIHCSDETFWVVSARSVLACIISYVLEAFDENEKNFSSVLEVYRAVINGVEKTELAIEIAKNYPHAYLDLCDTGRFYGIDQDDVAIAAAGERLSVYGDKVTIIRNNYCNAKAALAEMGVTGVDGIVLDLGVSSYQLDTGERGFSYRFDTDLDMRMDGLRKSVLLKKAERIEK